MTFLEMEQTTWYKAYQERIARDEEGMKSDFQFIVDAISGVAARVQGIIQWMGSMSQTQPPQSILGVGSGAP